MKKMIEMIARFLDITLLSYEEYKAAETNIPPVDGCWWLRTRGWYRDYAAYVSPGGVYGYGNFVYGDLGVRPALRFDPASLNLQIGEKVRFEGFVWTHVSEGLLLCDSIIAYMPFRKDWQAEDANKYEASDVKKFVESRFTLGEVPLTRQRRDARKPKQCKYHPRPKRRRKRRNNMKNYYVMEERILYDIYVDAHSIAVFPSIESAKAFMQEHYPDWEPRPFDGAKGCNLVLLWENKKNKRCGREFALGEVPADPAEAKWPKA